jgi:acetyl-CoA carboxylase carboxyl transferase subunit beta
MHFDKPTYSVARRRRRRASPRAFTPRTRHREILFNKEIEDNQMVVPKSGHHFPIGARERICEAPRRGLLC